MTEPPAVAAELEEVAPGIVHWRVANELIGGGWSSSHAVETQDGWVLVDPVPLAEESLARLQPVTVIVLTAATHQRSAWRYRRQFGAPVWLPHGSRETEEEPDEHYGDGDRLPGGLLALQTPGPELPHYSLLRRGEPTVLFSPDLVMCEQDGELTFVPGRFHEDPAETRRSVERSAQLDFEILCLSHGPPLRNGPSALRELLERTA
jgi:glyoxylase-like metal-dependent hydrolase (beta-lactamase superfamily II)